MPLSVVCAAPDDRRFPDVVVRVNLVVAQLPVPWKDDRTHT
jgi:hypothetical protein